MDPEGAILRNGNYPNTHAAVAEFTDGTLSKYPDCLLYNAWILARHLSAGTEAPSLGSS